MPLDFVIHSVHELKHFCTDKQGTITIRSDGRHISYDTAPCDDFTPGEMVLKPQDVTGADAGVMNGKAFLGL